MKYILEVLAGANGTPYPQKINAIRALDAYPHRKGQAVVAIYVKDGERKALLAVGTDVNKYDLIGEVEASTSITSIVNARDIVLREIIFEELLNEYQKIDGERRFGWLGVPGTLSDTWHNNGNVWRIPDGTSVQQAFEAILIGHASTTDEDFTVSISVTPTTITLPRGNRQYTLNLGKTGKLLQSVTLYKDSGSGWVIHDAQSSQVYSMKNAGTVNKAIVCDLYQSEDPAPGSSKDIHFKIVGIDSGGVSKEATCTFHIEYESQDTTNTTYTITYNAYGYGSAKAVQSATNKVFGPIEGQLPTYYSDPTTGNFGWTVNAGYVFVGWSKESNSQAIITSGISANDYIPVDGNGYNKALTLYGVWRPESASDVTYRVNYNPTLSQGDVISDTALNGAPVLRSDAPDTWTAPDSTEVPGEKMIFDGWAKQPNGQKITSLSASDFSGDDTEKICELYARWIEPEPPHEPVKTITVAATNSTALYDGKFHSHTPVLTVNYYEDGDLVRQLSSSEYTIASGSDESVGGTNAGPYTGGITVTLNDDAQVTASTSYTLTITKRTVTLTSAADSKQYDGTPLTNHNVTVTNNGFATGEGATYNVSGSQTDVGHSLNEFTYSLNANTLASNYTITTVKGTLTVTEVPLTVTFTTDGMSTPYNAQKSSQWSESDFNGIRGYSASDKYYSNRVNLTDYHYMVFDSVDYDANDKLEQTVVYTTVPCTISEVRLYSPGAQAWVDQTGGYEIVSSADGKTHGIKFIDEIETETLAVKIQRL